MRTAGWSKPSSLWCHIIVPRLLYQAAAAFAWMLRSNSSLLALDLSCNALGPAGAQELLAALPLNRCALRSVRTFPRHCLFIFTDLVLCCDNQFMLASSVVVCVCAQDAGRPGAEVFTGRGGG